MHKIAIVGAGHGGLHLGNLLAAQGHQVTIISNRTGEQVRSGRIMSSQSMYQPTVEMERQSGLAFWDEECPAISALAPKLGVQGNVVLQFSGSAGMGQSVDQRIKFPIWMDEFTRRGGKLEIREVEIPDIEILAASNDLVIIATGKGDLGRLFVRDAARSQFEQPARTIALTYLHGMIPRAEGGAFNLNILPGLGEIVHFPCLTLSGPCDVINIEAIPGSAMDRFSTVQPKTSAEHFQLTMDIIREFTPWEAPRFANARLTDDNGTMFGAITPTVRQPYAILPSGKPVLAIGDIFILNDPATGQGSGLATRAAMAYAAEIEQHKGAFDLAWMKTVTDSFWEATGQWVHRTVNTFLVPPAPYLQDMLGACAAQPKMADALAQGFAEPTTFKDWLFDEVDTAHKIAATV